MAWLWSRISSIAHAGQSWFVVTLVGKSRTNNYLPVILPLPAPLNCSSSNRHLPTTTSSPNVGMAIGINAALISITTEWLSDIKMGYCSDGWWLNQQFCCWEIEGGDEDTCEAWHQWSDVMPARWAIYVLFAVRGDSSTRKTPICSRSVPTVSILVRRCPSCTVLGTLCSRIRHL